MAEQLWGHISWKLVKMDVSEITFLQPRSLFGAPVYPPLLHQTQEQFMRAAKKQKITAARILLSFPLFPHRQEEDYSCTNFISGKSFDSSVSARK